MPLCCLGLYGMGSDGKWALTAPTVRLGTCRRAEDEQRACAEAGLRLETNYASQASEPRPDQAHLLSWFSCCTLLALACTLCTGSALSLSAATFSFHRFGLGLGAGRSLLCSSSFWDSLQFRRRAAAQLWTRGTSM